MADGAPAEDAQQLNFKVKTGSDGNHQISMLDSATVLDLKTKLAGEDFENVPVERQRLIYSGRVMKNEEPLSKYKIAQGNTIHMVKSAASNPAPKTTAAVPPAASVPTNMAAGTANNPLAGLTGARYAGHIGLPNASMFGVDGGMGAPPSEDQMADMLSDPATAQMMNEALNNPQLIDMMIQSIPQLQQLGPHAREILQSPMFRHMMTDPTYLRQAAAMRRAMGEAGGPGGAGAFPAPGATNTTPEGAARSGPGVPDSSTPGTGAANPADPFSFLGQPGAPGGGPMMNPFAMFGPPGATGAANAQNPFASLFGPGAFGVPGMTPTQSPPPPGSAGQTSPAPPADSAAGAGAPPPNPFASMYGDTAGARAGAGAGAGAMPPNPFGMTPEMMRQAMQMFSSGGFGGPGGGDMSNLFGVPPTGTAATPAAPADTRPPEEVYAEQLRQLNEMGFFDFEQNVQALRRAGGDVQGAIEQLLR